MIGLEAYFLGCPLSKLDDEMSVQYNPTHDSYHITEDELREEERYEELMELIEKEFKEELDEWALMGDELCS